MSTAPAGVGLLAYLQSDADWPPVQGNGDWAVYAYGRAPEIPVSEKRCEAGALSWNVIVRCLRERGHDGPHICHP